MPKTVQNEGQNLLKSGLGTLLGPFRSLLDASWEPSGANFRKKSKKLTFFEANLGAKMQRKSIKINVKKKHVLRHNFFPTFVEFLMDLGLNNIIIFHQMLV